MVRRQAEILRTGNSGKRPEANHVAGQDQPKNGHVGMYVYFCVARAIPVCHFAAAVKLSDTGFRQLAMKKTDMR